MKRRGRPPNAARLELAAQDRTVGDAVNALLSYGFKAQGPGGVFQTVAGIVSESDAYDKRQLTGERIKQIWKASDHDGLWRLQPQRYTRKSLIARRPGGNLEELARQLLHFCDVSVELYGMPMRPPGELTLKATRDLLPYPMLARTRLELQKELTPRPRGRPKKYPS